MLKKRFHNHYFCQTNPKNQPKLKTNLKNNQKKCLCTQDSYTTTRKPKGVINATIKQPSNCEKKKNCDHQQFFFYNKINTSTNPFNPKCSA
jgi:hypothetical protein